MPTVEEGPNALVRKAYMDLQAQRITSAEFRDILDRADRMRVAPQPMLEEMNRCYL